MPTWQVANYRLYFPSGHPDPHTMALVQLFDSTITNVVEIVFSTADPLPPNTNVRAFVPFAAHASLVEMLREEGPVFVINPNNTTVFIVATSPEPIGEDEGP